MRAALNNIEEGKMESKSIRQKIFEIQSEIKNPVKNTQGFGYKYATLEQVLDLIKPLLLSHRILLIQVPFNEEARIGINTNLTCMDSGESIGFQFAIEIPKRDPQGYGSAITYLRRYSLLSLFNLVQEDDDGKAAMAVEEDPAKEIISEIGKKLQGVKDKEFSKKVTDFVSKTKNIDQLNQVLSKVKGQITAQGENHHV
jgi:hypothetical protein